jgi:uncharacterized membrane protein YidH (DUF202 family)
VSNRIGPPDDPEDIDPTLARERTLLAWNRTSFAFLAVGGSMIKSAPLAGALVIAIGGLVWLLGNAHFRVSESGPIGRWLDPPRLFGIIARVTLGASIVALAVAVLARSSPR